MNRKKSSALYAEAVKLIPGGVNSPVRAFKAVGDTPPFIQRGSGCRIWDCDDNEYIDYIGSWGPLIAGHAHPEVVKSLCNTAGMGSSFGMPSPLETELAAEVCSRIPSIEKVRFVNSGTEAAMSAVRLARAFTGKNKIIKFAGCYHGHADSFLVAAGSGAATLALPNSPGVTEGSVNDTLIAPFNDLDAVDKLFHAAMSNPQKSRIAAVIVEPVAGNMGVVPPDSGFLEGLRALCDQYDALLILDEVMTGFRVHRHGAQALYNIKPDLTMLGKIIGGGLPVGAFGGRAEIMDMLAPSGPVYQAGTLSGNPLAMASGLTTLSLMTDATYHDLENTAAKLEAGLNKVLRQEQQDGRIQRVGSMMTLFFTTNPVRNFEDAQHADHSRFTQFFNNMLNNGVLLPPSGYEAWFISTAHTSEDIDFTIKAAKKSLAAM